MVSKRKSGSENEPGPSKKRKSEDKAKSELNTSTSKKRAKRKSKLKETTEKSQNSDVENDLKEQEDSSDVEMDNIETLKKTETVNSNSDVPNWPMAHMAELLRKIESILPPRDNLVFKSRADRLNWNEVAFANYSGAECRLMWDSITKRLRRFRILREMVDDAKSWISKPWTNFYRGSKTNRHPDMPRRPLSTYMIFYLKKKDKVLKENPGLEMTDLSKVIAEMYKKLSPKVKEKYNELALGQRKEYEAKVETFYRLHPELMPSNAKTNVNHANDLVPKKPPTPFKLFCEDKLKRSEHDIDFEKNTFIERCKEQWRNMSDKKKVFWINWALDKESKYQDELKKYIAENPDYVPSAAKSILTKEERTIRERMAGKPEKPPNSAYSLFSRLMLASEDVKTVSPKERMLLIAQQWKGCTDIEKKEYGDRVKHMLEQYKLQYAEYLESLPEDKRQEELLNNQPKKKTKNPKTVKPVITPTADVAATKRAKKPTKAKPAAAKIIKASNKTVSSKRENNLYEGEPQPPPATPYLLFAKLYLDSYPDKQDAHEAWEKLGEEQRNFHRRTLSDLKKVYIESYENFLKSLTQEELKDYSEWKKTVKLTTEDHSVSSDNSDSDSDQDCSSNSDSEVEQKTTGIKHEIPDESSSSE